MKAFLLLLMVLAFRFAGAQPTAYIVVQHSAVAGFRHYGGDAVWDDMRVGDALQLAPDRDNVHDPHAVRVEWRGRTIGYVPRGENSHLARQLGHGAPLQARVSRLEKSRNGRKRVSYVVFVPLE